MSRGGVKSLVARRALGALQTLYLSALVDKFEWDISPLPCSFTAHGLWQGQGSSTLLQAPNYVCPVEGLSNRKTSKSHTLSTCSQAGL